MTDLTKITTPFGLLDEATQKALRECGGPWEYFSDYDGWVDAINPQFHHLGGVTIRQKPQPPKPREWWDVCTKSLDGERIVVLARRETMNGAKHESDKYSRKTFIVRVREVLEP